MDFIRLNYPTSRYIKSSKRFPHDGQWINEQREPHLTIIECQLLIIIRTFRLHISLASYNHNKRENLLPHSLDYKKHSTYVP